jgi:hypothetical protein
MDGWTHKKRSPTGASPTGASPTGASPTGWRDSSSAGAGWRDSSAAGGATTPVAEGRKAAEPAAAGPRSGEVRARSSSSSSSGSGSSSSEVSPRNGPRDNGSPKASVFGQRSSVGGRSGISAAARCKTCKHGPGWCRKPGMPGHLPLVTPDEMYSDPEAAVRALPWLQLAA